MGKAIMHIMFAIILIVFISQAHATEHVTHYSWDTVVKKLSKKKLFERADVEALPFHDAGLEHTTQAKPGQVLARLPRTSPLYTRPEASYGNLARLALFRPRGYGLLDECVSCATRSNGNAQAWLTPAQLSRRHAGLAIFGGVGPMVAWPNAASADVFDLSTKMNSGPEGLEYLDKRVGQGPPVTEGSKIIAQYKLALLPEKGTFSGIFDFTLGDSNVMRGWNVAVMGGGDMPPMKVGGVRRVTLPPKLGYGSKGAGCVEGTCTIPPDSFLQILIELKPAE
eukprot:gnl/MRDRNA2_/MRDRNA2_34846_c0_seq1.p1 gnl/MRDRNA2_/MRDRNA2_34846_c0~~gnl/MRDRNA2_/MRDRNA2_34846_c0_seq1.p1  ORF type:complete len:281 (-),score=37.45 gnl/MRDRNA2_/MRDRNA2_34846_c0_seq1:17-859(-)